MPIMCTVQMPEGKGPEKVSALLTQRSKILMDELDAKPNEVRVTIDELPKNRYIAGGVMAYEMEGFDYTGSESKR